MVNGQCHRHREIELLPDCSGLVEDAEVTVTGLAGARGSTSDHAGCQKLGAPVWKSLFSGA